MRVFYELDKEDIRSMIADKYEVGIDKVIFKGQGEYVHAQIDMSTTEAPSPKEKVAPVIVPDPEDQKAAVPAPAPKEPDAQPGIFPDIHSYEELTDDHVREMYTQEVSVAALAKHFGWDRKIIYKLYKRFEKIGLEGASIRPGRKKHKKATAKRQPLL